MGRTTLCFARIRNADINTACGRPQAVISSLGIEGQGEVQAAQADDQGGGQMLRLQITHVPGSGISRSEDKVSLSTGNFASHLQSVVAIGYSARLIQIPLKVNPVS